MSGPNKLSGQRRWSIGADVSAGVMSASALLKALGANYQPTSQQAAIIEADPYSPAVVIAGAGSGKTTTMADRVLWLIANGHAQPHEVLGLTFTRKAAAELAVRIRNGLTRLRASGIGVVADGEPTVLTYHAYGQRILQEHALRIGLDASARPVRDAAIWQLAERVIARYPGSMDGVDLTLSRAVQAVLALSDQMGEHDIPVDSARAFAQELMERLDALPGKVIDAVAKPISVQRTRLHLLDLVEAVDAARMAQSAFSFGDQMSWAARVAREVPEVGMIERSRFSHVLLDEYQDTSQSQWTLMRSLFGGGHPVTAVGDPLQAIYEWRGASTGTIEAFSSDFPTRDGSPARHFPLTTSWRNDQAILDVANAFATSLRTHEGHSLQARPGANQGTVQMGLYLDPFAEAEAIATWLQEKWRAARGESMAILVRARSQIDAIERALLARDLPVEVVGVAGLLATPEVVEVRSMLQVLFEPDEGPALVRVLTGSRWRVGARDLAGLHRYSRVLRSTENRDVTLIDALDEVEKAPAEWFSTDGRNRILALAREVRALRKRGGIPLPDLVIELARVIGLEAEIAAMPADRSRRARTHLDSFVDQAAEFMTTGGGPISFLAWLSAAERRERGLSLEGIEPSADAIQILTIHTAKGLEWDHVVIPGLREGTFPESGRGEENWWSALDVLPFPLRGDRDRLPHFPQVADLKELRSALERFGEQCAERGLREEQRLAYVALTRPRHSLLLTSSWWGQGVKICGPSEVFLAARAVVGSLLHDEPQPDEQRREREVVAVQWPIDPLGPRRAALSNRAAAVRAASGPVSTVRGKAWQEEAELLLAAREEKAAPIALPTRLSVSALVQLRSDPEELARRLRRPMPYRPDPLARRGTAFHRWLEEHFQAQALFDLEEFSDDGTEIADLAALQQAWLSSEWAGRTPTEIEVPFDHVIDGLLIRGRMDAVYATTEGWEIVDWKTGPPKSGAELDAAAVQLAIYRLAWSRIAGVPLASISAAFHHVAAGVTIRPSDLLDEAGVISLIRSAQR